MCVNYKYKYFIVMSTLIGLLTWKLLTTTFICVFVTELIKVVVNCTTYGSICYVVMITVTMSITTNLIGLLRLLKMLFIYFLLYKNLNRMAKMEDFYPNSRVLGLLRAKTTWLTFTIAHSSVASTSVLIRVIINYSNYGRTCCPAELIEKERSGTNYGSNSISLSRDAASRPKWNNFKIKSIIVGLTITIFSIFFTDDAKLGSKNCIVVDNYVGLLIADTSIDRLYSSKLLHKDTR